MPLPTPPQASPFTVPDEDAAYAALTNLETLTALDVATPADEPTRLRFDLLRSRQADDRATLENYATHRRARNLTLFPTRTAAANKTRDDFLKNLHTKPFEEFLPAADLDRINSAAALTDNPELFRQTEANKAFLSTVTGRPLEGESYHLTRQAYANKFLGIKGIVDDATFYSTIRTRHQEDDNAAHATRQFASDQFKTLLTGEPTDLSAWNTHLAALPERTRTTARESLAAARREALDARRRLMPAVESVRNTVQSIATTDPGAATSRETAIRQLVVSMAENLPDDRSERALSLALIGVELSKLPEDDRPAAIRILDGIERGLNSIAEGTKALGYATITRTLADSQPAPGSPLDRTKDDLETTTNLRTKVAELKDVLSGKGSPLDLNKASDTFMQRAALWFAPSLPYTALAVTPYGLITMAAPMAGQSIQRAAIENPTGDKRAQYMAGLTSGLAQSAAETMFTRLGLRLATGRVPTLTNLLNRAGVQSRFGRATIGGALGIAAAEGTEYTEEVAQDTIDKTLQGLAAEFSGIKPDYQWGKFFKDWIPGNSEQSIETLTAIAPFAMLAGGIASVQHIRNGTFYLKHAALHQAAGFTPEESQAVFAATTPETAQQALETAFSAAQARAATLTPEQEADLAQKRQAAVAILKEQAQLRADAGMPVISTGPNEFTDDDQYLFPDPETARRTRQATEDAALEAFRQWSDQLPFDAIAKVNEAAEPDYIESLTTEGQAAEGIDVEDTGRAENLQTDKDRAEADLKKAEKQAITATTVAGKRDAADSAAKAKDIMGRIDARFRMFLHDRNLKPGAVSLSDLSIRAKSVARMIGGKVVGWTVQLFQGHTISDIVEDLAETVLKRSIEESLVSPYQIQEDIRAYETSTGRTLLPAGYDYTPEDSLPLVEAFSKLARGYLFSQVRAGTLPESVRQWAEMVTAYAASIVDVSKSTASEVIGDLRTAADLRAAIAAGTMPARLTAKLADATGINDQAREERLRQQMEAQLAAEAMEGFPEISQVLKGRLPHPATMAQNRLPFAGEIRRIYESLVRPTRAKNAKGHQINRTNEANAYFLPIGQTEDLDQLRRIINAEGFSFDTPAEMLEALELSIAYGKPQYGVQAPDFGEPTFSVGRTTITPSPATTVYPGAPGSPTVIGKATFAISAYHGTPHKVDRFTTDKIGTGEGAQAYGWGLYFAEAKEVGEEYKNRLSANLGGTSIYDRKDGSEIAKYRPQKIAETPEEIAAFYVAKSSSGPARLFQSALDTAREKAESPEVLAILESWTKRDVFSGSPVGNLYTVTINVSDEDLLDFDSSIDDLPEKTRTALKPFIKAVAADWSTNPTLPPITGVWQVVNGATLLAGTPEKLSKKLLKAGIRGIRFLDGASRSNGQGTYNYVIFDHNDITITEENGQPVNLSPMTSDQSTNDGAATFALSLKGLLTLDNTLTKLATQGPDERAEYYERLRNRLAALTLIARDSKRNAALDQTDAERERNRIRDAITEANAIRDALPPDARARLRFSIADLTEASTERGTINALIRLIADADDALEDSLVREYRDAFETLLDLAKPDLRQNKQLRGRLTPETQRLVGRILAITSLTPEEHYAATTAVEAAIQDLHSRTPASPEEANAMQAQLIENEIQRSFLQTFGPWSKLDAAQLSQAYQQLQNIYSKGRTQRVMLDEARREELKAAKSELLNTLPEVDQPTHTDKMHSRSLAMMADATRLAMSSFHQVMEYLFPNSLTARDTQDRVRKADRSYTWAKIRARERFDAFTYGIWNLTGPGRRRARNQILHKITTLRTDWNIQLKEGVTSEKMAMTEEQAVAILNGTMKPGWETDPIAMMSLSQALADFRMQRLKAQNEARAFTAKTIRFSRLKSRGTPAPFHASELEAAYYLQLWAQEQYRPALDKFGFTDDVIRQIESKLSTPALDLIEFMREEYDAEWNRLNPVYQAIYGMDMPKIRNYAPGSFEHLDAKAGGATIDPYGDSNPVNAMSAGFTKARTHHTARPKQQNALAAYWSHLEATEYFIAYAELMRDMRIIFRSPELRRRIEGLHGKDIANLFSQWLDALEVDGSFRAANVGFLADLGAKMLATQSAVGLAFNIGVLFKQIPAIFGVMLDTYDTKTALSGIIRAITRPETLKAVWNSEAIQQRILAGISPEDRKLMQAGAASPSDIILLLEYGRLPIAYADAFFSSISGAAAYEIAYTQATKAKLPEATARDHALATAARVIERTAQPATTQDKSMAEITAKGLQRFLFLFKSDPRQKLAITAAAVADWTRGRITGKTALRKLIWGWAIYGISNEVWSDVWAGISRDDDDEDRWSWRDYLAAMIVGPLSGLPIYGQTFEYFIRSTVGTRAYSSVGSPMESGATRIIPQTKKILKAIANDKETDATVNDYLTTAQQIAASFGLLAGSFDPRAAAVPAMLRLVRDAEGAVANTVDVFTRDDLETTTLDLIREASADDKKTRDGTTATNDALAKELAALPKDQRAARLARLPATQRTAIRSRLRAADMTPAEAALSRLSKEARAAVIVKIVSTLTDSERETYLQRLKDLGLSD